MSQQVCCHEGTVGVATNCNLACVHHASPVQLLHNPECHLCEQSLVAQMSQDCSKGRAPQRGSGLAAFAKAAEALNKVIRDRGVDMIKGVMQRYDRQQCDVFVNRHRNRAWQWEWYRAIATCTAALALAVSCSTYVLLGSSSPSATMGMVGPSRMAYRRANHSSGDVSPMLLKEKGLLRI